MYMYISTISVHLQLSLAKFETGQKKVAFKLVFWARSSHLPGTLQFLKTDFKAEVDGLKIEEGEGRN